MRSATAKTSFSLWVMKSTDRPDAASERMTLNRPSASCGVRTAVGSSRIMTCASRIKALTISTRC